MWVYRYGEISHTSAVSETCGRYLSYENGKVSIPNKELVHDTEVPILSYNHETELAAVVNLIYLAARDTYRVEREDKAGKGYVDFIFYPETDKSADCLI